MTAVNATSGEESLPSASVGVADDTSTLTWTDVATASSYNVYKFRGGSYGFIGSAGTGMVLACSVRGVSHAGPLRARWNWALNSIGLMTLMVQAGVVDTVRSRFPADAAHDSIWQVLSAVISALSTTNAPPTAWARSAATVDNKMAVASFERPGSLILPVHPPCMTRHTPPPAGQR